MQGVEILKKGNNGTVLQGVEMRAQASMESHKNT